MSEPTDEPREPMTRDLAAERRQKRAAIDKALGAFAKHLAGAVTPEALRAAIRRELGEPDWQALCGLSLAEALSLTTLGQLGAAIERLNQDKPKGRTTR